MGSLLIIPAAGLGSRLQASVPKLLFPVNGKPMIDYLFDLYAPVVERFMLVLHPDFKDEVERHCAATGYPIDYEVQPSPTGMLDAILIPRERVRSYQPSHIWITWCDQVAVFPQTIAHLAAATTQDARAALTFPTLVRPHPYIHFVRDGQGGIVEVLHQREGDAMPEVGESDMGLFCLSRNAYLDLLPAFAEESSRGTLTRESNFLPFVAWLHGHAPVSTFPGHDAIEAVGINTRDDLHRVETYLRNAR